MSTVFALLFLLFLGLLIWGLISPKSLSKAGKKPMTRGDALIGFGFITLVFMVLTGVTAPKKDSITPAPAKASTEQQIDTTKTKAAEKLDEVTTKTVTETQAIPFESTSVNDSSLAKGSTKVKTAGVNGVKTLTYEVTYTGGKETARKLVKEVVTTQPVAQVTSIGTYVKPASKPVSQPVATTPSSSGSSNCDPNYEGACVPNVYPSDVDCGGGSGNGPYYVYGTVHVIGTDRYNLDGNDNDGYGCE